MNGTDWTQVPAEKKLNIIISFHYASWNLTF